MGKSNLVCFFFYNFPMKYKNIIYEITLSGLLMALAIALSFATFKIGGGGVYLIGIAVFVMPLMLRLPFAFISGIASVVIADALSGYIMYTWISVIAYGSAIIIIWLSKLLKFKFIYIIGLLIASFVIVLIYYLLDLVMWDQSYATADAIATLIQFAIVVPIVSIIYQPLKLISKISK